MDIQVFPIHMQVDTIYVVKGDGVILIDAGDPGQVKKLQQGLEKASILPQEVRLIVLTHGHWDHIGSSRDIQALTGAPVLMHQEDLHFVDEAKISQPPGFTAWGKFIISLLSVYTRNMHIPEFAVDLVAGDEAVSLREYGIPGTVVHTPGHSWGSVSVLLDDGRAFVGDLGMSMFPMRLSPGLPIFGDDMELVKQSWRKLLDLGARVVYPAHGKPFSAEVMRQAVGSG